MTDATALIVQNDKKLTVIEHKKLRDVVYVTVYVDGKQETIKESEIYVPYFAREADV